MDKKYWNALASDFSTEVLEISDNDIDGVIADCAERLGGESKYAIDFGCGAGAATRLLGPHFKSVLGVDFSAGLLRNARRRTTARNISYELADLVKRYTAPRKCDVAFCVNVLIDPSTDIRKKIAANIVSNTKRRGVAVIVTPSLESALRAYQVTLQCQLDAGESEKTASRAIDRQASDEIASLSRGVLNIGGAPTKHFFGDELVGFLQRRGLTDIKLERVAYPWSELLDHAPDDLDAAPPWDWLALGVKK